MIELTNLIITWLISVALAFGVGYFFAQKRGDSRRKAVITEKAELSAEQVYKREKRAQEERNFWSYDGSEQVN